MADPSRDSNRTVGGEWPSRGRDKLSDDRANANIDPARVEHSNDDDVYRKLSLFDLIQHELSRQQSHTQASELPVQLPQESSNQNRPQPTSSGRSMRPSRTQNKVSSFIEQAGPSREGKQPTGNFAIKHVEQAGPSGRDKNPSAITATGKDRQPSVITPTEEAGSSVCFSPEEAWVMISQSRGLPSGASGARETQQPLLGMSESIAGGRARRSVTLSLPPQPPPPPPSRARRALRRVYSFFRRGAGGNDDRSTRK